MRVQLLRQNGEWKEAALVDFLPRGEPLTAELGARYFGFHEPDSKYLPRPFGRFVFRLADGQYAVLPDSEYCEMFWRFSDETEVG